MINAFLLKLQRSKTCGTFFISLSLLPSDFWQALYDLQKLSDYWINKNLRLLSLTGDGAMGLSNSIGANTLDIFLCLGLPWLIKTASTGTEVEIVSSSIIFSFFGMLVTVVILFLAIALNKFRLNKVFGGISLLLYVAFIVVSVLLEMNVFFFVNWPMCDPTDWSTPRC